MLNSYPPGKSNEPCLPRLSDQVVVAKVNPAQGRD